MYEKLYDLLDDEFSELVIFECQIYKMNGMLNDQLFLQQIKQGRDINTHRNTNFEIMENLFPAGHQIFALEPKEGRIHLSEMIRMGFRFFEILMQKFHLLQNMEKQPSLQRLA